MNSVFLDTVGLIAVLDVDDQWHAAAESAYRLLSSKNRILVTTTFVLSECGNSATRRPYRSAVARLRERFEIDRLLISPAEADWREAWNCYVRREGNSAGIVDCISFVVMRRLGIQEVFTNDEHFRAAGFETLF